MIKAYSVLAASAALLSLSPAVFAQAQAQTQANAAASLSDAFDSLDANKDRQIDRAESQSSPVVSQSFASADKDGSGALSREEFNASFTMRSPAPATTESPPTSSPPQ